LASIQAGDGCRIAAGAGDRALIEDVAQTTVDKTECAGQRGIEIDLTGQCICECYFSEAVVHKISLSSTSPIDHSVVRPVAVQRLIRAAGANDIHQTIGGQLL
jgi:hypothetical protein